ncbi:MAG: glycosyltransferase family A protein [Balneolaceae bacterium]|nr:glycosyltransferase family A protein [Balneolaceae bacterium]
MVTANRKQLMKRSIQCFNNQDYLNKELVIVDDGEQDLSEALAAVDEGQLNYVKLEPSEDNTLGKLRNISLQEASGEYLVQWDDDDWYHPDRIKIQAQYLDDGYDACCLSGALMHLDDETYINHPYVGYLPEGIPGSIMHKNDTSITYPHSRRAEDTVYLKEWMEKKYTKLPDDYAYLFIRCYHGNNTWEKITLFGARATPLEIYSIHLVPIPDEQSFGLPVFQLDEKAEEAFRQYLEESKRLDLLETDV